MTNANVVKEQTQDGKWRVGVRLTRNDKLSDDVDMTGVLDGTRIVDTEHEADAEVTKVQGFVDNIGADEMYNMVLQQGQFK
jgi:hypothetical protein